MARKDKKVTPSVTQKLQSLGYDVSDWDDSGTKITEEIREVLKTSSKKQNHKVGFPDRIFVDEREKLLILVEEKPSVQEHLLDGIEKGAVSGIKWYLSRFLNDNLKKTLKDCFLPWKILGIAASGDFNSEYNNKFSAFYIEQESQKILLVPQLKAFVTREKFLALFNTLDEENAVSKIEQSSKKINSLLRSIDSQKRPVLLSALMISLHKAAGIENDFITSYQTYNPSLLARELFPRTQKVLNAEGIPNEKIDALEIELAFVKTDSILSQTNTLKNILHELSETVIPLFDNAFSTGSNYDIIGSFYEEFLRFAGVSNVKKGIVLTPRHITTLFTELIPIKQNDVILDLASGTGAFLIAGMNAIINQIKESKSSDMEKKIDKVKREQLLGFEINPTMYISSISNMLFRGDGKSAIFNYDSINDKRSLELLKKRKPTIGFINPPYSGKENKNDPTPKEITFIETMLDNCSRYGLVIAPVSVFFKDKDRRNQLLQRHTLKYVINMPDELFAPNAATHTTIAVFETYKPHNYAEEVTFYDLVDDGFVLTSKKGRTDAFGRWEGIKEKLIEAVVKDKVQPDGTILVKKAITAEDEWTVQQHSAVDYSQLSQSDFLETIADFEMFRARRTLGLMENKISDFKLYTAFSEYFSQNDVPIFKIDDLKENIDIANWKLFDLTGAQGLFRKYSHGNRLTVPKREEGDFPLITAGEYYQGFAQNIGNYRIDELFPPSITIDMFFNVFYQDTPFAADDNVYSFNNRFINFETAMFIVTILKQQKKKYGFGRQFRQYNAETTQILLPVAKKKEWRQVEGNKLRKIEVPDYDYMNKYIKKLISGK